jgi:hypothetical protein
LLGKDFAGRKVGRACGIGGEKEGDGPPGDLSDDVELSVK